jgi:hypothetical protein
MRYSAVGCIVTFTLSMLVAPLTAEAQQVTKVPQVGFLVLGVLLLDPIPRLKLSGRVYASSATSRARTSSLRTVMRRGAKNGSATWRPNWPGSQWT